MISFLIEQSIWDEEPKLLETLRFEKVPYYLHPYSDFDPGFVPSNISNIFCYGSLEWIAQIQKYGDPNLVTICTLPNFDCREYYKYFEDYLFNWFCLFIPFSQFIKDIQYVFDDYNSRIFMRPAAGNKPGGTTGAIWTPSNFDENLKYTRLEPDSVVLIGEVKHIEYEWRTIISNGKYLTGSQYKSYDHQTNRLGVDPSNQCPERVAHFVNKVMLKVNWCPDNIFVMDIVESKDEELAIMEINALSTSGWYDCDVASLIKEMGYNN